MKLKRQIWAITMTVISLGLTGSKRTSANSTRISTFLSKILPITRGVRTTAEKGMRVLKEMTLPSGREEYSIVTSTLPRIKMPLDILSMPVMIMSSTSARIALLMSGSLPGILMSSLTINWVQAAGRGRRIKNCPSEVPMMISSTPSKFISRTMRRAMSIRSTRE